MKNKFNEKNHNTQHAHHTSRGITLVALVITIIVLLILAGVAINLAVNSAGLFAKTNEAANKWNSAVGEEKNSVQNLLNHMGIRAPGELPAGWNKNKIASTVTETSEITGTIKEREVPIPKGFTASKVIGENTIAGGLVIYQTETPVTSSNHTTALTEYNQYVWIPVDDINQMVMCKSNTDENHCNLVLQDDGILQCTNPAHSANKTNLCGRLYGVDATTTDTTTPKIYTTNMNFADRSQKWDAPYHEPDISSYDNDDTTGNLTAFTQNMINDFKNMAVSVAKYGGFYVSRYEAEENGASKKNQKVLTAGENTSNVYIGVNNWYGLYNTLRQEIKQGETKILQSHMIYGCQYDQILNFVGAEAQTGHTDRTTTQQSTGYEGDSDILKNIYDLEGNNWEWTAQADGPYYRHKRGGCCFNAGSGNFYPASTKLGNRPNFISNTITSRGVLYL